MATFSSPAWRPIVAPPTDVGAWFFHSASDFRYHWSYQIFGSLGVTGRTCNVPTSVDVRHSFNIGIGDRSNRRKRDKQRSDPGSTARQCGVVATCGKHQSLEERMASRIVCRYLSGKRHVHSSAHKKCENGRFWAYFTIDAGARRQIDMKPSTWVQCVEKCTLFHFIPVI